MVNNFRREIISLEIEPEPTTGDIYYAVMPNCTAIITLFFEKKLKFFLINWMQTNKTKTAAYHQAHNEDFAMGVGRLEPKVKIFCSKHDSFKWRSERTGTTTRTTNGGLGAQPQQPGAMGLWGQAGSRWAIFVIFFGKE